MNRLNQKLTAIPDSLARLFQEYDFASIDIMEYANTIIERTLEMGTWQELHWLFHTYGIKRIIDYLSDFGHHRLSKQAFNYWCKLLYVKKFRCLPWTKIRKDVWKT
jgi:hypothetical protein